MFLITGATGTIGSEITRLLREGGIEHRAMTRHPDGVPNGVFGDFDEPSSLAEAVTGVDALFLLGFGGPGFPAHDLSMIDVAAQAGVRKIVKLSAIPIGSVAEWHRPGEDALRDIDVAWTVLRPTTFASNSLSWAEAVRTGQPITNPTGDGRQGVIDPRDVAAVAVEALRSDDHGGQIYTLTGPELLSVRDQVATLAEVLDTSVSTVGITLDELRTNLLASGMPASFVEGVVSGSELVLAGHNAVLTGDVEQVLGRPPHSYATWVVDHRAAFM